MVCILKPQCFSFALFYSEPFFYFPVVDCGVPPSVSYSSVSYTLTVYEAIVDYECEEGYSLQETDPANKTFSIQCQANQQWTQSLNCTGELMLNFVWH